MKSLMNILKLLLLIAIVILGMYLLYSLGEKYDLSVKQLGLFALAMAQPVLLGYISYCYLDDKKRGLKNAGKVWLCFFAGYEIIGIGLLLSAGNQSGIFPTFPFAGTLTIAVGSAAAVFGNIFRIKSNIPNS